MDYRTLSIHQILDEAEAIARDAQAAFGQLNAEQLNWKPSADSWSVAQCFDHLIRINSAYYPVFDQIMSGEHKPPLMTRIPFLATVFGRMMVKSLSPDATQKFKAPVVARPSPSSAIEADIVERFVTHQHEILAKMRLLGDLEPAATVIRSPFAPLPYSLLDAFRIVVAHERRHMAQARRVTASERFPPS